MNVFSLNVMRKAIKSIYKLLIGKQLINVQEAIIVRRELLLMQMDDMFLFLADTLYADVTIPFSYVTSTVYKQDVQINPQHPESIIRIEVSQYQIFLVGITDDKRTLYLYLFT